MIFYRDGVAYGKWDDKNGSKRRVWRRWGLFSSSVNHLTPGPTCQPYPLPACGHQRRPPAEAQDASASRASGILLFFCSTILYLPLDYMYDNNEERGDRDASASRARGIVYGTETTMPAAHLGHFKAHWYVILTTTIYIQLFCYIWITNAHDS